MRSWRILLAVALPVVVLMTSIGLSEYHLRTGETWRFPIAGFDPRDLLRGQYIRFRLRLIEDQPLEECSATDRGDCCFCLDRRDDVTAAPRIRRATCATARAQCRGSLSQADAEGEQRFYAPEAHARGLASKLQNAVHGSATVELSISSGGRPQVRRLLIDGKPLQ